MQLSECHESRVLGIIRFASWRIADFYPHRSFSEGGSITSCSRICITLTLMGFFTNLSGLNQKKEVDVHNDTETKEEMSEENWLADDYEEGQLSIDVYQTKDNIIVKSTIAGVKSEDIDISVNNDMLTIRGKREMKEEVKEDSYFYQECYWGNFSRSIILPVEVKTDKIDATIENGILTVTLPKAQTEKQISVKVKN